MNHLLRLMSELRSLPLTYWLRFASGIMLLPLLIALLLLPLRDYISSTDVAMLQMLWIAWIAQRYGKGRAIATTVTSVLLLNWYFVAPYYTLDVHDSRNLISFVAMMLLGMFIGYLAELNRRRLAKIRRSVSQLRVLYQLAKGLGGCHDFSAQCQLSEKLLSRRLKASIRVRPGQFPGQGQAASIQLAVGNADTPGHISLAESVYRHHQPLLHAAQALLSQSAITLELQQQSHEQALQMELEQHRAMLLRSLSHDLRTPLATIMGASSMLADPELPLTPAQQRQQAANIYQQSLLLNQHFEKVLELSKAQLAAPLQYSDFSSDDLLAGAFARRPDLPAFLAQDFSCPLAQQLKGQADLLEIALANMLENALRHGSPPFVLELQVKPLPAAPQDEAAPAKVAPGQQQQFRLCLRNQWHSDHQHSERSHGLGIAICQTVAALHQGTFCLRRPEANAEAPGNGSPAQVEAILEWTA